MTKAERAALYQQPKPRPVTVVRTNGDKFVVHTVSVVNDRDIKTIRLTQRPDRTTIKVG